MVGTRTATCVSIFRRGTANFRLVLRFISAITGNGGIARVRGLEASIGIGSSRFSVLRFCYRVCRFVRVLRASSGFILNRTNHGVNVDVHASVKVSARDRVNCLVLDDDGFICRFRFEGEFCVRARSSMFRSRIGLPVNFTCSHGSGFTYEGSNASDDASFSAARAVYSRATFASGNGRFQVNIYFCYVICKVIEVFNGLLISDQRYVARRFHVMVVREYLRDARLVS